MDRAGGSGSVSDELVREQIRGETDDPKKSDIAREQAVADLGPIDVDKTEEMQSDEFRILTGAVYDKERPHLPSEAEIAHNAMVRRGRQKLHWTTSSFREAEEDLELEPEPLESPSVLKAVHDAPLTASA